jgi:type IV pilus assembly protein PilB
LLRDIYEWLMKEKGIDFKTIQAIREYERKNNCTPYTAIEKMEICSLGEIQEGIFNIYQLKSFKRNIEDLQTAEVVSYDVMRNNKFAVMYDPKGKKEDLYVLIFDPVNRVPAVDAVKRTNFKGRLAIFWITESIFEYWKRLTSKHHSNVSFQKLSEGISRVETMDDSGTIEENNVNADESDQKIVDLTNEIIEKAIEVGSSDIHIEPLAGGCRVRYRIDGVLIPIHELDDKSLVKRLINRIKVVGRMDVNNSRTPQSGKIKFSTYDIRVSTMPAVEGEKVVLRILNSQQGAARTLPQLGFKPESERMLRKMFTRPYGIILVSGPTGSGKSSTLAAILNELNTDDVCMITIEDPVEYRISGATQVNVNPAAGLTFASVLRETLRQDPNIIMVGEVRDKETAEISMQASNTGHLVFSTIHTNSALSAITRLNDMGIDGYLVADNIIGIVSQSLIRKLCPHCRKKHIITAEDVEKYYAPKSLIGVESYEAGDGCDKCNGTGYSGRTVAFEILEMSPAITKAIHNRVATGEIEKIAEKQNFVKKLDYAYDLVREGTTTLHEVSRVIGGIISEEANN